MPTPPDYIEISLETIKRLTPSLKEEAARELLILIKELLVSGLDAGVVISVICEGVLGPRAEEYDEKMKEISLELKKLIDLFKSSSGDKQQLEYLSSVEFRERLMSITSRANLTHIDLLEELLSAINKSEIDKSTQGHWSVFINLALYRIEEQEEALLKLRAALLNQTDS